jgi:hypothetical protein
VVSLPAAKTAVEPYLWLDLIPKAGNADRTKGSATMPAVKRIIGARVSHKRSDPGPPPSISPRETRVDREFCKERPCKQKYHYRKKAGWSGYD